MATHTGSEGTVKVGSNAIAEIRSYSISEVGDTVEDTAMGDTAKTYKASFTDFSGSVETYFDDTDTAHNNCTAGSSIVLNLLMEGNTSGDHKLTGSAIVTSRSIGVSSDGIVTATYSFQGTGGLTETTVT